MTGVRIYISGMGIVSSIGRGIAETREAVQKGLKGIRPLRLFPTAPHQPLPVGEVPGLSEDDSLPRTHQLARLAAEQAMAECERAPDAVVLGITTGGLRTGIYRFNGLFVRNRRLENCVGNVAGRYRQTGFGRRSGFIVPSNLLRF
jgi:3-oxoacyl-(acyl-carrier-protein) synthase